MESYSGSFDVVPSSESPPDDAPDRCALCTDGPPAWWYVVEPDGDSGRLVESTAPARWWALCAECDGLIALGAVDKVRDRAAAPDTTSALLGRGVRSGHTIS
ncbi:hypothetical protein GCM10027273_02940 [Nocardioides pakistanensis]